MQEIEQIALQTYKNNLTYLEKFHPELFKKVSTFQEAIAQRYYQERYSLEYLHNSYFDVKELQSNNFLYNENSLEYSHKLISATNKKKDDFIFQAIGHMEEKSDAVAQEIDSSELHFHNIHWATIKIINYTRKHYAKSTSNMTRAHKIMFIDIGLGLHLQEIINKLNPQVVYINESDLELFRLSLFTTDYSQFQNDKILIFSIAQNETETRKSFTEFLELQSSYNLHLKYIPFSNNYMARTQQLLAILPYQPHIIYDYNAILLKYINSIKYLPKGYNYINISKAYLKTVFSKKPVLLLFSGPSSHKHLEWIIENRDRFILVCALSTCRLLNQHNLTPDVIVHIDPAIEYTGALFNGIDTKTFFKDTICIFASDMPEETVNRFYKNRIFFVESDINYKKGFVSFTAPSVGEYTYVLFLMFGATKMFILGMDFALDPDTLESHGSHHQSNIQVSLENNQSTNFDFARNISYIQGNFLAQVPTLPIYKISAEEFSKYTGILKKEYHHVYNLGNGAYLEGAEPLHVEDYNWKQFKKLDKNKTFKEVQNFFKSASSSTYTDEDKAIVLFQLSQAKKLQELILQFEIQAPMKDVSLYLQALSKLSLELSDVDQDYSPHLGYVYSLYFKVILSYIFDMFNTEDLQNPQKRVEELHAIIIEQLLKISKLYISRLGQDK